MVKVDLLIDSDIHHMLVSYGFTTYSYTLIGLLPMWVCLQVYYPCGCAYGFTTIMYYYGF